VSWRQQPANDGYFLALKIEVCGSKSPELGKKFHLAHRSVDIGTYGNIKNFWWALPYKFIVIKYTFLRAMPTLPLLNECDRCTIACRVGIAVIFIKEMSRFWAMPTYL
jgi:hypothetical protein